MVLDQLLVTDLISHCTDDGGASVYLIASYLMARVGHTLKILAIDRKLGI